MNQAHYTTKQAPTYTGPAHSDIQQVPRVTAQWRCWNSGKKTTRTLQVDLSKSLKFDSPALFFRYVNVVYINIIIIIIHMIPGVYLNICFICDLRLNSQQRQVVTTSVPDLSARHPNLAWKGLGRESLMSPQTSWFRPQFTIMEYHILQNKRYENPLCKLSKINKPGFFRGLWTFNECDNRRTEGKKMICLGMKRNSKWSRTTWLPVMNYSHYSQVFFFTLAVQKNNLEQLSFEWKVTIPGTSCKLALLLRTVDSRT